MESIVSTIVGSLLAVAAGGLVYAMKWAYMAGRVLSRVESRLDEHDRRIAAIEGRGP